MATAAQQRAQAAATAAIARAQAHIRRPPEPDDNPADTYITPTVARLMRLDLEEDRRHA